jgi:hypothetical protein
LQNKKARVRFSSNAEVKKKEDKWRIKEDGDQIIGKPSTIG